MVPFLEDGIIEHDEVASMKKTLLGKRFKKNTFFPRKSVYSFTYSTDNGILESCFFRVVTAIRKFILCTLKKAFISEVMF